MKRLFIALAMVLLLAVPLSAGDKKFKPVKKLRRWRRLSRRLMEVLVLSRSRWRNGRLAL